MVQPLLDDYCQKNEAKTQSNTQMYFCCRTLYEQRRGEHQITFVVVEIIHWVFSVLGLPQICSHIHCTVIYLLHKWEQILWNSFKSCYLCGKDYKEHLQNILMLGGNILLRKTFRSLWFVCKHSDLPISNNLYWRKKMWKPDNVICYIVLRAFLLLSSKTVDSTAWSLKAAQDVDDFSFNLPSSVQGRRCRCSKLQVAL